jgi:phage tail-like protein
MSTRQIPDGAGVTNHYSGSFAPWVTEGNFISLSGLSDEIEVIDGPDKRGYATGQPTRQTLTVVVSSNDPTSAQMHIWKNAVEQGLPGHRSIGVVSVMDNGRNPVATFELEDCICMKFDHNDLQLDGAEVAQETFELSYSRLRRIS